METESLINKIQKEVITYLWANGAEAKFEYEKDQIAYRLIRVNYDSNSFLIRPQERNDTNCPILATGFVAFLIRNWGKSEQWIFDKYYNNCLNKYKQAEQKKPGSSMRDLDNEFYPFHVTQEKEFVTFSEKIHSFLSKTDIELINQYIEAYFKYIEQVFAPKKITENILSVPDWCIVFYYLDEAGTKEGNKIDRMEKFIEGHNVLSPSGTLTTKGNFKKEYHKIENRINGKNDKKPLPPERIGNILPYLKNNKKALKAAKSDIKHLTDIKEESEKNYY